MSYHVELSERAIKELKKLDKHTAALILGWVRKQLDGCENPRAFGKGLTANQSGKWRYRIGDYRLICDIEDGRLLVLILDAGHRSEVYRI